MKTNEISIIWSIMNKLKKIMKKHISSDLDQGGPVASNCHKHLSQSAAAIKKCRKQIGKIGHKCSKVLN